MTHFIQLAVMGLAMGSIYALVALGVALIYNSIRGLNFAQGEFLMFGAYVALTASSFARLPYVWGLALAILGSAFLGFAFERTTCYPLRVRGAHPTAVLVSTLGVSIFLRNVAMLVWGPLPMFYAEPFGSAVLRWRGYSLPPQYVLILGATGLLVAGLYLFLEKSGPGQMLRASSDDPETASLVGVRVQQMVSLAFVVGGMLAGVGGVLLAPVFFVTTEMGYLVGMKAFASSIVGGFGTIRGAIIGGLLLGIIEMVCASYISSTYKDVFAFLVLILMLQVRPQGLVGRGVAEKV